MSLQPQSNSVGPLARESRSRRQVSTQPRGSFGMRVEFEEGGATPEELAACRSFMGWYAAKVIADASEKA